MDSEGMNSNANVNVNFNQNQKKINPSKKNNPNKKGYNSRKKELPLKIVPLGGLEQVGENMMFMEYKNDIIIIDAGMLMPGGDQYGIDYVIPDITTLKKKKSKIKGIFVTHGHLDHIGALKHILDVLDYPVIYGTNLTVSLIKKTLEGTDHLTKADLRIINPDVDVVKLGCFNVEFFRVNHSIPEAVGMAINTPKGLIAHTGDFKIDFTPALERPIDLAKISRIGKEGVRLLFSDSTNATKQGKTPSEKEVGENLESIIKSSDSRLIIATFSSLIGRISQIIEYAVKYNKIVFLSGRSMINNVEIAKQLGYIKPPKGVVRVLNQDVDAIPDNRVIILTTGSQGEEFSALSRIAKGEHTQITIREGDKILFSASPIPGNEKPVIDITNKLILKGADIITHQDLDLHVSGHGRQDDLKIMYSLMAPEHFVPVHGELFMRHAHKKLYEGLGMPQENIHLIHNGDILNVYNNTIEKSEKSLKLDTVMIDGLGIGSMSGEYVMKARRIMAEDGMIGLIFKVDSDTKELVGNIQIESRGFVYSSEVKKIHTNIIEYVKKKYNTYLNKSNDKNLKEILKYIKEDLSDYLTKKVGRVPMIVPMFVYINRNNQNITQGSETEEEVMVGMNLEEQAQNENKTNQ